MCTALMPAARANHAPLEGMCFRCWADTRKAAPPAPMYETEAWSKGIRL
jgi:hypothetical protein